MLIFPIRVVPRDIGFERWKARAKGAALVEFVIRNGAYTETERPGKDLIYVFSGYTCGNFWRDIGTSTLIGIPYSVQWLLEYK